MKGKVFGLVESEKKGEKTIE